MSEAAILPPPQTIADLNAFLAGLRGDGAWELVDGRIVAMTNPSLDHAELVDNLATPLRAAMPPDRSCRVARGDVRLQMSDDVRGLHAPRPDIMVWCGPKHGARSFVTAPLVVAEVLSPATMDLDRGPKLRLYKQGFQTLRHILLIYQDQRRVEWYVRADAAWEMRVLTRAEETIVLPELVFEIALAGIYAGVDLPG